VAGGAPLDWKWAVINDAQQQLSQRHAEARTSLYRTSAYVSIRQHTSAYVSIRQHTSAYVSIRQHTSVYVSIRQHTYSIRQQGQACVHIVCLLCWNKSTNTDAFTSTKVNILTQRRRADGAALRESRRMPTYADVGWRMLTYAGVC
jgi:hypothetical protein